ncbi:hypothetical protein BTVI_65319 [Pitangus sulphuratus]|nr:hypothetical protein BTVI_65319 [Pitangus sulphuratus]
MYDLIRIQPMSYEVHQEKHLKFQIIMFEFICKTADEVCTIELQKNINRKHENSRKSERHGTGQSEEEKAQGGLINVCKYLKEGCKEDRAMVPNVGTTGSGHNRKHRRFSLNVRNDFVSVSLTKPWHMLLSEFVESPFSEILKIQYEPYAEPDPDLRSGVGLDDLQRHL